MTRRSCLVASRVTVAILVGAACGPSVPENPADLVLTGGHIVTMADGAAVGKLADMVVLSRDIMTIAAPQILETEVLTTILGGRIVYEATAQE